VLAFAIIANMYAENHCRYNAKISNNIAFLFQNCRFKLVDKYSTLMYINNCAVCKDHLVKTGTSGVTMIRQIQRKHLSLIRMIIAATMTSLSGLRFVFPRL